MMTCSVHGNAGTSPLIKVAPHTWQARVTIHQSGVYDRGTVWTVEGRALEFVMAEPQEFSAGGLLMLTIFDNDPGLPVELRRELLGLAA